MGIDIDATQLLTPPLVAAHWLAAHVTGPVALFVAEATRREFSACTVLSDQAESGAAALVVGDLGDGWDFATLNRALRLLMADETPLLALGMARYWRADDGLRLDVGAMVSALSYATGREPIVLGKPSATFFQTALDWLGVAAGATLMVGDDILGDVQGAQQAGLRGALVRTGKFQPSDLAGAVVPDVVLADIAELPGWWRAQPAGGQALS